MNDFVLNWSLFRPKDISVYSVAVPKLLFLQNWIYIGSRYCAVIDAHIIRNLSLFILTPSVVIRQSSRKQALDSSQFLLYRLSRV